jgi:hypothetical protein
MRNAMKLRYSLFPYNYTNARTAYDSAVSMMRPMYYDYPTNENAYTFANQYMFGPDLLVSPVTKPMQKDAVKGDALFATQKVWLPKGEWYEWNSGSLIQGDRVIERPFMLDEMPLYVRSGAIIPMQPDMKRIGEKAIDPLILNIFPGKSGKTRVYDDAGNDLGFKKNEFTFTAISFEKKDSILKAQIQPIEGSYPGMLESRSYEIRLPLTFVPVSVKVNGKPVSFSPDANAAGWQYDGSNLMTVVKTDRFNVSEKVDVEIVFPALDVHQLSGVIGKADKVFFVSRQVIASSQWQNQLYDFDAITNAGQTLNRIGIHPDNNYILAEKTKLESNYAPIMGAFEKHKAMNQARFTPFFELLNAAK